MEETVGERVRAVRESRGEKQPQFAETLSLAAKRLGFDERYDNTTVSKMEVGRREVSLTDVIVISSVDKKKRGREWLAWGKSPAVILLDQQLDRGLTREEEARALSAAERIAAEQRSTTASRRGRGRSGGPA